MQILKNPWKENFLNLVETAQESIKITSPFVTRNICKDIFSLKQKTTRFELITTFKLSHAHNGSLDIAALSHVITHHGIVKHNPRLHAKMYIFDDQKAVITSGNLTNGGLISNFEYGIFINNQYLVQDIVNDFKSLSEHHLTGTIKEEHIVTATEILSKIPEIPAIPFPTLEIGSPEISQDIIQDSIVAIRSSLSGWKFDVFNCLSQIHSQDIFLSEIYEFEPHLQKLHPKNHNVQAKIRQQLQELRDIGLLEFVTDGQYRKLWS